MVSVIFLEVYGILVPASVLLLLFFVPVSFVYKLVSKFINMIEGPNFHGVTFFFALGLVAFIALVSDMKSISNMHPNPEFHDISLVLKSENKRLRLERNIYIHACAAVLCLSIKKIASLNMQIIGKSNLKKQQ